MSRERFEYFRSQFLEEKEVALNSVYVPIDIQRLVRNIPVNTIIDEKNIVENNTLFKIFTAFLDEERTSIVYEGMIKGDRFNAFQPLGLVGSKIRMKDELFFCRECLKEDLEKYGESYWRDTHQVPGVYICKKHEVFLIESEVASSQSRCEYRILNE